MGTSNRDQITLKDLRTASTKFRTVLCQGRSFNVSPSHYYTENLLPDVRFKKTP